MVRTKCETSSPTSKRELSAFQKSIKRVTVIIDDEELVAVAPERRNWKGIFIALLVIAAVFSLIIFSIFLLTPVVEVDRMRGRRITLNDVLGKGLKWKPFRGNWISNKELVFKDSTGGLSILNPEDLKIRILMTNSTFRQLNAEFFDMSPDQKYVLLISDSSSDGSRFHVYEVDTQHIFPLTEKENAIEPSKLQHVVWAPSNGRLVSQNIKTSAQGIAFVHDNDLYYKPKVRGDLVCRITKNGKLNSIYNGVPDWTYSNIPELKGSTVLFSPDGLYLSYLTFNDTLVQQYKYTLMSDTKYPTVKALRYPKAGTNNPNVTVYIVNLSVLKYIFPQQIKLPNGMGNGSYVGAMTWSSNLDLSITITNRKQTKATTLMCKAPAFVCQEVHTEVTISDGWVLPSEVPIFSKEFIYDNLTTSTTHDTSNYNNEKNVTNSSESMVSSNHPAFLLKRLPVRDGDSGHFRHIVLISPIDRHGIPLTMGKFEVTKIVGWDEKNELIYFLAAPEGKPGERHLYKIDFNVKNINRTRIASEKPQCLTCNHTAATFDASLLVERENLSSSATTITNDNSCSYDIPNNCYYNDIYFSNDYSYYIQECLGPESPSVYLVETSTNLKIYTVDNGEHLRKKVHQLSVPQIRIFNVEIRHGFHAQVKLYLPPGMKEEEEVSFPLVLEIDASPGSQLVSQKFNVDWNWYLCSQRQIIVAQIDARGSGYQGELLRTQIHGKLGSVEIEDQLGVLTYLRDNLKFIDPARICAYGWGYGGFATAMALIDDSQQILQCGISINPITSFGYYYSFFTERYIPVNEDFNKALQESDLAMKAGNLKGRNFLIIYSTADTLVHQDHSILLSKSLIDQDIKFKHQVYPDEDHDISGYIYHLYNTIEWYIDDSFGPIEQIEWDPAGLFEFRQ